MFDATGDGHLRIEMRALPAGPTVVDEAANAAFLIGLTLALAPAAGRWPGRLPFPPVRRSFYLAARHGLDATVAWPAPDGATLDEIPVMELMPRLVPLAADGLRHAGVDEDEVERLLEVVAERVRTRATGAGWQRRALDVLGDRLGRERALAATLDRYADLAEAGLPVHRWPTAS